MTAPRKSKIEKVEERIFTRHEADARIDGYIKKVFGDKATRATVFRKLDRGDLDGTLAGVKLKAYRLLSLPSS